MEQTIKIRNHISSIFAASIRVLGALAVIIVINMWDSIGELSDVNMSEQGEAIGWTALALAGLCVVILLWQLFVWAKTHIILESQTLVVEKNTLFRRRNTIGLKNVSNVNLEQTVLDRIFGTSKVKLDTDSFSTANQTDVTIVLKTPVAEAFRDELRRRVQLCTEPEMQVTAVQETVSETPMPKNAFEIKSQLKDIIRHGLLLISPLSVVFGIVALVMFVVSLKEVLTTQDSEVFANALYFVGAGGWFFVSVAWSIAKGFLNYADFKVSRQGDKVELNYGMLKKVSYTIPVNRIHAVSIKQSMISRMFKCAMVEILNVGMGDDEDEKNSFFLPYAPLKTIEAQMQQLLPECVEGFGIEAKRQPKAIWKLWLVSMAIYVLIGAAAVGIVFLFVPAEYWLPTLGIGLGVYGLLGLLLGLAKMMDYKTSGVGVGQQYLKLVNGYYAKTTVLIRYKDVQFIHFKQNVLAKRYQIQHGIVHILASGLNQIQLVSYCTEETGEQLMKKVINA